MTPAELERLVLRHNWARTAIGVILGLGAIPLWYFSFWVWQWLALVCIKLLDLAEPEKISFYVAIFCTLVLAVEGARYRGELFNLAEYRQSIYYDNPLRDSSLINTYMTYRYGDPMGIAYLVSQALLCAPRCTVQALANLRSRIRTKPETIAAANAIYRQLFAHHRWTEAESFPAGGAALCLLDQLGLIWTDCEQGKVTVRAPGDGRDRMGARPGPT